MVAGLTLLVVRRWRLTASVLIPLGFAGAMTAAASALLNIPFNFANVIVLPLLLGLGVDSGVHLAMRRARMAEGSGVFETSTPRAVTLSALTTAAAFGSLALSPHQGTASMGLMLAIALAAALICVLAITPVLAGGRRA